MNGACDYINTLISYAAAVCIKEYHEGNRRRMFSNASGEMLCCICYSVTHLERFCCIQ